MYRQIVPVIEKELNLPEGSILEQRQLHKVCVGRYMAYRYLHEEKKWSASRISKCFHRTRYNVFRGISVLRNFMKYDTVLRVQYFSLIEKLDGMTEATPSENMNKEVV